MKILKKLFIVLLFAFSLKTDAQISLLNSYPITYFRYSLQSVYLKHDGFKFVNWHSDTLSFYNMNLTPFRSTVFPSAWMSQQFSVEYISEGLFDNDSLHIDYVLNGDSVVIYKDNGSVVYRNDSAVLPQYTTYQYGIGMGGPVFYPVMSTDSGTFMVLTQMSSTNAIANQLYKLPGSLPCVPGCLGDFYASMPQISNNSSGAMSIYPNPAVSYTNIYYTLPEGTKNGELVLYDLAGREIKKYTVTSRVDHLLLTTSDIKAGTYFYQLLVNGIGISTKKIVVVK